MRPLSTLPKAHLHLHFTGSMRPGTLADLATKHRIRLPEALLDTEPIQLPPTERGWFRFQRLYDAARACVRDELDMRRIVSEAVEDDAREGSGRLEIQVDPTSYAPFVGGITPALEIVLDEARAASTRFGVSVGVVVAASRTRHPSMLGRLPVWLHAMRAMATVRLSASGCPMMSVAGQRGSLRPRSVLRARLVCCACHTVESCWGQIT
jgi:adenosine deaminase